jgi:UDPglucose 6-dehydrogenase
VSAACLSVIGHTVRVLDVNADLVDALNAGACPFYEPGLDALLARARADNRLVFGTDPKSALSDADVVFLCVGTPNRPDGQVDLGAVMAAVDAASEHVDDGTLVANRSTCPVGTADYIRAILEERRGDAVRVAVNPEFLAEGRAVDDFMSPDRLVVGSWTESDRDLLLAVYEPIISRRVPDFAQADSSDAIGSAGSGTRATAPPSVELGFPPSGAGESSQIPVIVTEPRTAELIKYASNAFLATKISFINEIASIAEELGGDVTEIQKALGLDRRIGPHFLRAGIGWGGSCFPKDIVALQGMAEVRGLDARIVRAANEVNQQQHRWVVRKLQRHLKTLVGRRVALLGLAFKPHTDDLRDARAVELAIELASQNVRVRAYDPAVNELPAHLQDRIELRVDVFSAADRAEAIVLVTEWPEFAEIDFTQLKKVMREPLLLDGRNFFDPVAVRKAGFIYEGVGRQ